MPFEVTDFRLRMTVGDDEELETPVTAVQVSHELNRIPQGVVTLPVGTDMSKMTRAKSHDIFEQNTLHQVRCRIYAIVDVREGYDPAPPVENGEYRVFDGYVTGPGFRRSASNLGLSFNLTGWLDSLNFSSVLSATSHPSNPADFTFDAVRDNADSSGATYDYRTATQMAMTAEDVRSDLWGKAIKPWFEELASRDKLEIPEFPDIRRNDTPGGEVNEALRNMIAPTPLTLYSGDGGETLESLMAEKIKEMISDVTAFPQNGLGAMANTTFWNKLVGELAGAFMFAVSPGPGFARVVPFIPGLRTHHMPKPVREPEEGEEPEEVENFTILARDVDGIDFSGRLLRQIRAVALYSDNIESVAGSHSLEEGAPQPPAIAGAFFGAERGMLVMYRAPRFLETLNGASEDYADDTLLRGPTAGNPANRTPTPKARPGDAERRTLRKNFAQALYAYETLKGRHGNLIGTVRFDIAPGSVVKIQGLKKDTPTVFATAVRVVHSFDAENGQASTGFQLAHVRNAKENESDVTSVPAHPIYQTAWAGGRFDKVGESASPAVLDALGRIPGVNETDTIVARDGDDEATGSAGDGIR